jgi:hypothetical protein
MELTVLQDQLVPQALLEPMAHREHPGRQVLQVRQEIMVLMDYRGLLDLQALELLARQEIMVLMDYLELLVLLELELLVRLVLV